MVRADGCESQSVLNGQGGDNSHRFDTLFSASSDVNAEHTVTPPFAFACKALESHHVAQSGLD